MSDKPRTAAAMSARLSEIGELFAKANPNYRSIPNWRALLAEEEALKTEYRHALRAEGAVRIRPT
jgi:hypothetical protein